MQLDRALDDLTPEGVHNVELETTGDEDHARMAAAEYKQSMQIANIQAGN